MTTTQAWTFKDIQKQAEQEGITISKASFRKHIDQGLFCGTKHPIGGSKGSEDATYERGMESLRLISKWKKRPFRYKPGEMLILLYMHGLPVKLDKLYEQLQDFHLVVKQQLAEAEGHLETEGTWYRENQRAEKLSQFSESRSGPLPREVREKLDKEVQKEVDRFLGLMRIFASLQRNGGLSLDSFSSFIQTDLNPMVSALTEEDVKAFLALPLFQKSTWDQMMNTRTNQMISHLDAFRQQVRTQWAKILDSPLWADDVQQLLGDWSEIWGNENHLTDVIGLMRPLLYIWVASGASTWLVDWLQHPETMEKLDNALQQPHYSKVQPLIDLSDLSASPLTKGGDSGESTHL